MNKTLTERHRASLQSPTSRAPQPERDSNAELARILGGIGTPTESCFLTARMQAVIDDLGDGWAR